MYKDKLARGLFLDETKRHGHRDSIRLDTIKNLSKKLGNPIAVFDSATVKGSLVALYDVEDKKHNWIMASISPNREKPESLIVNLVTSIYGKDSERKYADWIDRGLLRYVDDTKERELIVRLQLPSTNSLYKNNVLRKSPLVNKTHCLKKTYHHFLIFAVHLQFHFLYERNHLSFELLGKVLVLREQGNIISLNCCSYVRIIT